ncbi:MAG: Xaa-Pro peptidase family protein [Ignavibacteriales bacterium]|nr:Xaa-Pro peptidase family protein [Ignavibacteriales bacterium]
MIPSKDYSELIREIQHALQAERIDGWLLYNFRDSNIFATRLLALPKHIMFTRRYFYYIPAHGAPKKLVHRIEEWNLDALPGGKSIYLSWRSLEGGLKELLSGAKQIAMEYSPRCAIPYVSTVDAGTVELVRGTGVEIVSSANLIQYFEARWDDEQLKDNMESAAHLYQIVEETFGFIRKNIKSNTAMTEYDVQQFMSSEFKKRGLVTSSDPNCSVNANSANPHYEPTKEIHSPLHKGDYVLLDLWAKKDKQRSVYADITWMGFLGDTVPDEFEKIFQIVKGGRNAALDFVRSSLKAGTIIHGYEVDDAARNYITQHGYGEYFVHRTGHSIGEEVHGNGANMDNLETRDERTIIPQTSFSLEPGIYLRDKYGIRSEIDVYISKDLEVIVTGLSMQEKVVPILQ